MRTSEDSHFFARHLRLDLAAFARQAVPAGLERWVTRMRTPKDGHSSSAIFGSIWPSSHDDRPATKELLDATGEDGHFLSAIFGSIWPPSHAKLLGVRSCPR
jgi:hypothetical protein